MINLTELPVWQQLASHQAAIGEGHMRDWFEQDSQRFSRFTLQTQEILFDYSRNRITETTLNLLFELANSVQLSSKIDALFSGHAINITENRAALHTALRDPLHTPIMLDGENISIKIADMRRKMQQFVTDIHTGKKCGVTGKSIKHIVNIGIGGSYLGPKMCAQALKQYAISDLQLHFISSVDKTHLNEVLKQIDAETTLFIVSSKSFSTLETLTNANTLAGYMQAKFGKAALSHHFIAITACDEKALQFGIAKENIFPLWDWVGGRYSIWSAIGLPLMLLIGEAHFTEFLAGAHALDLHFKHTEFNQNIPVILALLGVWYMNFFGAKVQAIIPYAHRLKSLISYLQQAEMESNGKGINIHGSMIPYATSPVIFGEEGCNGQHAYHQLLHQGQHFIPVDFILVAASSEENEISHQDILLASGLSQAQALMRGKTYQEAYEELTTAGLHPDYAKALANHQIIPGNRPSNVLLLDRLTPRNLGALIALYEHKIFVQGAIWQINSFDQWGVELGKQLLPTILRCVKGEAPTQPIDSATLGLINHYKKISKVL